MCHYTLLSFFFACCFLSTASLPSLPPSFSQFNTLSVSLGHSSHSPLSASHLPQDLFLSPMSPLSSVTYKHTHPILVDSSWEKRCDIFLNLFLLLLDVVISIYINFSAKIMISVFLRLCKIPLCACTMFSLSVHLLMNILVGSIFWLLLTAVSMDVLCWLKVLTTFVLLFVIVLKEDTVRKKRSKTL